MPDDRVRYFIPDPVVLEHGNRVTDARGVLDRGVGDQVVETTSGTRTTVVGIDVGGRSVEEAAAPLSVPALCVRNRPSSVAIVPRLVLIEDDELIRWKKHPNNPIIPIPKPGEPGDGLYKVWDPYLWLEGDRAEDHLAHAAWNILGVCHFEEAMPSMIDVPARSLQE